MIAIIYAHFPSAIRRSIYQRLVFWLKPRSHIILEAFNASQLQNTSGGPKDSSMLLTKEIPEADFVELTTKEIYYEKIQLHEGGFHKGVADVVRCLGRKG